MKRTLPLLSVGLLWACGDASPVVLGTIEDGTLRQALVTADDDDSDSDSDRSGRPSGRLELEVNGELRDIRVGRDGSFAIQDLPSGELELSIAVEGLRGTLTIEAVQPGEVVELALALGPGRLELRVARRQAPDRTEDRPLPNDGAPIVLRGHRVVYYLEPGVYTGPVTIEGHDVTLVGASAWDCAEEDRSILAGEVTIKGHRVRLVNVGLRGPQSIKGHDVRVVSSCDR